MNLDIAGDVNSTSISQGLYSWIYFSSPLITCFPNNPSVHGALRFVFLAWGQAHPKVFLYHNLFFEHFCRTGKRKVKGCGKILTVASWSTSAGSVKNHLWGLRMLLTMKRGVESASAAYVTRNLYVRSAFKNIWKYINKPTSVKFAAKYFLTNTIWDGIWTYTVKTRNFHANTAMLSLL